MPMIIVAALIYGAIFPVNRTAADIGWPPLTFSFLQSLGGAIVLALVAIIKGERIGFTRSHIMAYIVIGGLVVGLPMGLLVTAAPHLDPSVLTLVLCLSPILTLFIGILLRIETFDRRILFGMIMGLIGIGIIVSPQTGIIAPESAGWFVISLGAPVMFATANNLAQYQASGNGIAFDGCRYIGGCSGCGSCCCAAFWSGAYPREYWSSVVNAACCGRSHQCRFLCFVF